MVERLGLWGMSLLGLLVAPAWAAEVIGAWSVTISTAGGTIAGKASLKQAGKIVTGWVGPSEDDPIPINGTVEGNKLTIKTSPQPGRSPSINVT